VNKTEYKIGLSTTIDYTVDIKEQIRLFARSNIDFISVGANISHSGFYDNDKFNQILDLAHDNSLFVDSGHIPFGADYNIADKDREKRHAAIENTLKFLGFIDSFKIPKAIIHPHHYLQEDRQEVFEKSMESLRLISEAMPEKIKLAIENLPTADGNWICDKILSSLDNNRLGFCYDSSHENMSGEPFFLLKKFSDKIIATHLSDNHGYSDEHLIPGQGIIDWHGLKSYLDKSDKLENLLFEIGTGEKLSEPLTVFLERALRGISRYFDRY
jgi:sugar phosphate isomerase/epimerase